MNLREARQTAEKQRALVLTMRTIRPCSYYTAVLWPWQEPSKQMAGSGVESSSGIDDYLFTARRCNSHPSGGCSQDSCSTSSGGLHRALIYFLIIEFCAVTAASARGI